MRSALDLNTDGPEQLRYLGVDDLTAAVAPASAPLSFRVEHRLDTAV